MAAKNTYHHTPSFKYHSSSVYTGHAHRTHTHNTHAHSGSIDMISFSHFSLSGKVFMYICVCVPVHVLRASMESSMKSPLKRARTLTAHKWSQKYWKNLQNETITDQVVSVHHHVGAHTKYLKWEKKLIRQKFFKNCLCYLD